MSRRVRQRDRAAVQVQFNGSVASAFEAIRADYDMAKDSKFRRRLTGYSPMGSGADYHYRSESDYLKMMELARSIDRNDMVVPQAVTRLCTNVIQQGFRVDPDTGDDGADEAIRAKWRQWSEDPDLCDAAGEHDFNTIAENALRAAIVDGDQFFLPLGTGQLQTMEAHRCRTPRGTKRNVVHGVLLDPVTRKPIEYWFTNEDIEPMRQIARVNEITPVRARDERGNRTVFHLRFTTRASQTRGVSAFAPTINATGMHEDIQFAKLVQQQMVSMVSFFRERSPDGVYTTNAAMGAVEDEPLDDGATRTVMEMAPGMEITGQPGEKLHGFSPNVPNAEYFEHVRMILMFIGCNLNLPLIVMLLDASATNFSGWRGAFDQAKQGFRRLQRLMIARFYRPIYLWKVRQWSVQDREIATLRSLHGDRIFNHYWTAPRWGYIEPLKDAQADTLRIKERLNSRRDVLLELGLDIEEVDRDAVADQVRWLSACAEAAKGLSAQYPEAGFTWRDVANQAIAPVVGKETTDRADETDDEPEAPTRNGNGKKGRG